MLFTTAAFALVYLPLTVIIFYALGRFSHIGAATWLFAASVFFYGYWMPQFTLLLLGSITVNFLIGRQIGLVADGQRMYGITRRGWLVLGLVFNLALLAYFKYANFFVDTLQALLSFDAHLARIVLPIGISFFTFTQIAFLVDAYKLGLREYRFAHYGLFVTYFPHLIAGPVLHHAQMMPQFQRAETYRFQYPNFAAGVAIFALGLAKKIIVADGISPFADAIFNGVAEGGEATFSEAWLGAFAYTMQLYFDFSGYSDMAIGLSWMMNVSLPFNFDSPYKATSIVQFWRSWHMTLSAFLRDYLYIPLGGNRKGPFMRHVNLAVTMLLGGLWHGANWTFVFWGGLHGLYLIINHAWRSLTAGASHALDRSRVFSVFSWALTLLAVMIAWVFFRAPGFDSAASMLGAMSQPSLPVSAQDHALLWNAGLHSLTGWCMVVALLAVVALAPNSNAIGKYLRDLCHARPRFCALLCGFSVLLVLLLILINETRDSVSAFIYFNF
jgi:alginate O-acetyltransferase complex protein AlgI